MNTSLEIAELVSRIRDGDRAAGRLLRDLVDSSATMIPLDSMAAAAADNEIVLELLLEVIDRQGLADSAIRRLIFDHHLVDDVRQDTLIAVARSIGSFRSESRFTTWLYQVARNTAIAALRQRSGDVPESFRSESERISSMIATRSMLSAQINALPLHYRKAVTLRDVDQLSYQDIADRLALNLNTVKSHVARGRALVAAGLREQSG